MSLSLAQLDSSSSDGFFSDVNTDGTVSGGKVGDLPPPDSHLFDMNAGTEFGADVTVPQPEVAPTESEAPKESEVSESAKEPSTEAPSVSIDVRGKQKTFKLDPNDEVLRRTLRNGERAASVKAENDKLKAERSDLDGKVKTFGEAHEVIQELKSLVSTGDTMDLERAVKAILGDDKFADLMRAQFDEYENYKSASPEERARMSAERRLKDTSYAERMKDREIQKLRNDIKSENEKRNDGVIHGYATTALGEHKFKESDIPDDDIRYRLNKRAWNNSWETIREVSATREITPALINKVFEREFNLLKHATKGNNAAAVSKSVEQKKAVAATTAAAVATSNYPKPAQSGGVDISKWNGKSAKDLLNLFRK
jgi:hypothetical protein